jgi:hypothetical protein
MRIRILLLLAALVAAGSAMAQVVIIPIVSLAPRHSPNITPYNQNALFAIRNGLTSYNSNPANPASIFERVTGDIMIDSIYAAPTPSAPEFNMWRGIFDPAATLGSAYASQSGNSLSFGFMVAPDNGQQVSLNNLSIHIGSETGIDINAVFPFYSSSFAGVLKGADGVLWTADDTLVTSGAKTQLVDALIGRGSGFALPIAASTPGATWFDRVEHERLTRSSLPLELTTQYRYRRVRVLSDAAPVGYADPGAAVQTPVLPRSSATGASPSLAFAALLKAAGQSASSRPSPGRLFYCLRGDTMCASPHYAFLLQSRPRGRDRIRIDGRGG